MAVSDDLFRLMIESVEDYAIFMLATDGTVISWNLGAERLQGYKPEEIIGQHFSRFYAEEDIRAGKPQRELEITAAKGRTAHEGWRLRKDGSRFWASVTMTAIRDRDGNLRGFCKVHRNVRERNLAEKVRLQAHLLQLSDDAIMQRYPNGLIEAWNRGAENLYGFTAEEACGRISHDLLRTRFPQPLKEIEATVEATGRWEGELVHTTKDGRTVIVSAKFQLILGDDGVWRLLETNRDITETRRLAEEAMRHAAERLSLKESEHRFRTLAEALPQIVWIATPDGWNTYINQQWVTYTGVTQEETLGLGWDRLVHPDDRQRVWDAWHQAVQTDSPYSIEGRLRRADGTYRWFLIRAVSLHDDNGKVTDWFGTATDVDEIKRTEEILRRTRDETEAANARLRESQSALQRAVAARDQVLGIVAHDLRNPLSTIILQSSILGRHGSEPERRNQRPREIISRAAARMSRLIQDLLDVSLLEAGELKIQRTPLSTRELVVEAVESEVPLASSSGLEIRLDVDGDLDEVWGDKERLHQVLENLIGNAIKFTKAGGRITVGATSRDQDVVFSVADTGCGIAPEDLAHVFDRFWQATTNGRRLGAGLGLPITKGIVEAHGGRIWVESTPSQGSTFFFSIPTGPRGEDQATFALSSNQTH
jgi:PAS domain S-box-containing protein